ncbi:anthranilate phosphoribosyltransferase, partial [Ascosphaera acerosa]
MPPPPSPPAVPVSIAPLLARLADPATGGRDVAASELAAAFALIFEDRLSAVQMAAFLALLHSTGRDRDPDVIVQCAARMRDAAEQVDRQAMAAVIERSSRGRRRREGTYEGGF